MDCKKLKGSETEKNLYKTFAGESRARNKYNMYAEKARLEGYQWIADIFDETAKNEFAHAREVFNRYLGNVRSTAENLVSAMGGETEEFRKLYKEFEETARREGYTEIADFYKELREVEEAHAERYKELYEKVKDGKVFSSSEPTGWICLNCGYIHEGEEAPKVCPLCKFPRAYFKEKCKE
jgi:rubrerythrin